MAKRITSKDMDEVFGIDSPAENLSSTTDFLEAVQQRNEAVAALKETASALEETRTELAKARKSADTLCATIKSLTDNPDPALKAANAVKKAIADNIPAVARDLTIDFADRLKEAHDRAYEAFDQQLRKHQDRIDDSKGSVTIPTWVFFLIFLSLLTLFGFFISVAILSSIDLDIEQVEYALKVYTERDTCPRLCVALNTILTLHRDLSSRLTCCVLALLSSTLIPLLSHLYSRRSD